LARDSITHAPGSRELATEFVERSRVVFARALRPRQFVRHHCDECRE